MLPRVSSQQAATARHRWFEHHWRNQQQRRQQKWSPASGTTTAYQPPPLASQQKFGVESGTAMEETTKMMAGDGGDGAVKKMDGGADAAVAAAAATVPAPPVVNEAEATMREEKQALPKLSAKEFKIYNRMAEHMDYFHNHFRQTWNTLHTACTNNKRPAGMSLRSFLSLGEQFATHLTMHHTIEEQHVFPMLARKMPAFREELQLLSQHHQIHEGLVQFERYLAEVRRGERELVLPELGKIMDGFGGVLWRHLDEEVRELGAENMRKFWSVEEMKRMPM